MTYQKMLAVLAQCELTMVKSVQVHRMNVREQENYTKLNSEIGNRVCLVSIFATQYITHCKL